MAANGLESKRGKALPGGIYVPTATFFKDTPEQELDLETFTKHMEWLARAGVHGVTVQGSTGEAALLTREERITVSCFSALWDVWVGRCGLRLRDPLRSLGCLVFFPTLTIHREGEGTHGIASSPSASHKTSHVADSQLLRIAKEAFARVGNPGLIIAGTVGAQSTWENVQLAKDAASAGSDYILTLPPNYYAPAMSPAAIQAFYEDVSLMLCRLSPILFPHPPSLLRAHSRAGGRS